MDVELILHALEEIEWHCTVQIAGTGNEALEYLKGQNAFADRTRFPLPDLILLDVNLPDLEGPEVLAHIKAVPMVRRVPVIVFTSSVEETDCALCYDNGCNSYLKKPPSFDGYVEVVRDLANYWLNRNVPPPA